MPRKSKATPAPAPRKRGNQPHVPTDANREAVKIMVAGGMLYDAIASAIGVSLRTLHQHYRKDLDSGVAALSLVVLSKHVERIKDGDMRAIEWWEKSRLGWSEKMVVEAPQPMRVIVELVGDAPPATAARQDKPRTAATGIQVDLVG